MRHCVAKELLKIACKFCAEAILGINGVYSKPDLFEALDSARFKK
jgi:hypothetical protein